MPVSSSSSSSRSFRILLAQRNPTVGDLAANGAALLDIWRKGAELGVDLAVASELFVCGYPPEDLMLDGSFRAALTGVASWLSASAPSSGPALAFGLPYRDDDDEGLFYNALMVLDSDGTLGVTRKIHLPNYGVFDEKRLFRPGDAARPIAVRGRRLGFMICEDMWLPEPAGTLKRQGAEALIVVNGSPFEEGKQAQRFALARRRIAETGLPLAYVNQIGGQDELVFDGGSFAMNEKGETIAAAPLFAPADLIVPWQAGSNGLTCPSSPLSSRSSPSPSASETREDRIYRALTLGLRDYVRKNGFERVYLGLSGGIDSALAAALAVDALGADRVKPLTMPSRHNAAAGLKDARDCADALGIELACLPIDAAVAAVETMLAPFFADLPVGVAEENLQSRMRGLILMAFANKFGGLVVSTGNKSELAVGYATLYGDMNGGFNPLKDVYKRDVYALARRRNAHRPEGAMGPEGRIIPETILIKAPSAELRPDQKDSDSLPDYPALDAALAALIEKRQGVDALIADDHDPQLVIRVAEMLQRAEHKRRQAAPGVKIGAAAFGRDWRCPIANRFDVAARNDKPSR